MSTDKEVDINLKLLINLSLYAIFLPSLHSFLKLVSAIF